MADWGILEYAALAQVLATIGVVVSLYLSVRALAEVRADRRLRQRPHLMFEPGGMSLPLRMVTSSSPRLGGLNPDFVASALRGIPGANRTNVVATPTDAQVPPHYGRLKNFGSGPALETRVVWVPSEVSIGGDTFEITQAKLQEPLYGESMNSMPPIPRHIEPSVQAGLSRLPGFIAKDVDRKISKARGYLEITYKDVFGEVHLTRQAFLLQPRYTEDESVLWVTFSDVKDDQGGAV